MSQSFSAPSFLKKIPYLCLYRYAENGTKIHEICWLKGILIREQRQWVKKWANCDTQNMVQWEPGQTYLFFPPIEMGVFECVLGDTITERMFTLGSPHGGTNSAPAARDHVCNSWCRETSANSDLKSWVAGRGTPPGSSSDVSWGKSVFWHLVCLLSLVPSLLSSLDV